MRPLENWSVVTNFRIGGDCSRSHEAGGWDWSLYEWNGNGMALHPVGQPKERPGFNYMGFGVLPFSDATGRLEKRLSPDRLRPARNPGARAYK